MEEGILPDLGGILVHFDGVVTTLALGPVKPVKVFLTVEGVVLRVAGLLQILTALLTLDALWMVGLLLNGQHVGITDGFLTADTTRRLQRRLRRLKRCRMGRQQGLEQIVIVVV